MSFASNFNGLISPAHNRTNNIHDMDQDSNSSFQSNRAMAPSSSSSSNDDDPIFRELEYADAADQEAADAAAEGDDEADVDVELLEATASTAITTAIATNNDTTTTMANNSHNNSRNNSIKHHTASPKAKKLTVQEKHIRSILLEALPVNSLVTDETLDRLSRAVKALVSEASSAAAAKVASLASSAAAAATTTVKVPTALSSSKGAAAKVAANKAYASGKNPAVVIRKPSAASNLTLKGTRQTPTRATGRTGAISKSSAMPKGKPHKIAAPASNAAIASEEDVQMEEEEEDKEEDVDDEGEEYEVEKILDHRRPRGRRGAYQFRLKWKGYLESESTWEDKSALDHCQELLLEYAEMNDLTL